MKLNIGDSIKRMRKEMDITQEEFAQVFGVSCQSVSRWESGACYPDIELIPDIAKFFGVSADRLMGIDEGVENESIGRILGEFQAAISKGKIYDCIDIARRGVSEHPNNYVLLNKLMYALFVSGSDDADIPDWKENMEKYDAEIVAFGERLMKHCPDMEIRAEATARLAFQHCEMGRKDIGRRIYETLPTLNHCREIAIWWALDEKEKLPHTRELIDKAYSLLSTGIYQLSYLLSDDDAIKVFEKSDAIDRIMYDGKVFEGTYCSCKHNYCIAKHYIKLGNYEKAFEHLTVCAKSAVAFDNRPEERKEYSLLLGEQTDRRSDFETADSRPLTEIVRDMWLSDSVFDEIRGTEEFNYIIRSL